MGEKTHPTLEGHPAWEAFKRAPLDPNPVSEEERRECAEAARGPFLKTRPVDWSTLPPAFVAKYRAAMAKRAANPPKVYVRETLPCIKRPSDG
jgi:hypothetical protein